MSMQIQITFETDEFIIVDKPHNMFVHPTNLNRQEKVSVVGELSRSLGHPLFAVHRLDRPIRMFAPRERPALCWTAELTL